MISLTVTTILLSVALYYFYKWATANYDFFEKRGIPFERPFPLLGNFSGMFFRTRSMFEELKRFHVKFNSPIYGLFEMRNPMIVLKDTELIRQVTVKDFEHFMNHWDTIAGDIVTGDNPLYFNSIFLMKDQKWKDMRTILSPAYTGSKLRIIFQFIEECCEEAMKNIKKCKDIKAEDLVFDVKEFFSRYTSDVIASSAFGIEMNSMNDSGNQFYKMGRKVTTFTTWILIKIALCTHFKSLMKILRIQLFDEECTEYYTRLVNETMKYRSAHNIIRPDTIHLLMEAQKLKQNSHEMEWTADEVVAQCFLLFIAGFDTSASCMSFAAHELMENPETQVKLLAEIDEVKEELNGKPLTYEILQGMKYMDMVVAETLRKWPSIIATDRVCRKPYVLKTDNINVKVEVDDVISIPITGLHYDPENFPNPNQFDPERFSDENKGNIKPFTYAPFGLGPRNCIGSRLALLAAKAILYHILSEYTFEASEKTSIPLEMVKTGLKLYPVGGFWLKLVSRT